MPVCLMVLRVTKRPWRWRMNETDRFKRRGDKDVTATPYPTQFEDIDVTATPYPTRIVYLPLTVAMYLYSIIARKWGVLGIFYVLYLAPFLSALIPSSLAPYASPGPSLN